MVLQRTARELMTLEMQPAFLVLKTKRNKERNLFKKKKSLKNSEGLASISSAHGAPS